MKEHIEQCASKKPKHYGDARNAFPNEMQDCDCDGYHTFTELYDHRITLFIALCRNVLDSENTGIVWRSKVHYDGSSFDGWFILGINKGKGAQITYHIPLARWDETNFVNQTLELAPEWDGHTPADVLERLNNL